MLQLILWCSTDALSPCSMLSQHQGLSSSTKPIMHCRGHAHTLMRETRKDKFFCRVDDLATALHRAATQLNMRVNSCSLCARSALCFDPDPRLRPSFQPSDQGEEKKSTSGEDTLTCWKQKKQQEASTETAFKFHLSQKSVIK